ncbi:hypothetical protein [Pseudomonas syringae group genomosp. 3]|uniref:hypothetical protein n=1 Tax=Pseudomonas syringae group genomosp. 3 TaxID=251701 RepID=UPI0006E5984B|nr:hypothetical protein [Pseudomonas syringae group genomosp. 3]KPW57774.1 Uncharacterized protein ALO86_00434 [Pseudomonas syringae pv. berberidis]KPY18227.1 Uncharacterized protein ALO54_00172 [Pseudomonas syringae pv. philadelphi]RMM30528.1 hypothetical protein ALQ83_04051 [Pseudomonas syringae pv. berberidis]RMP64481.1 hypothetical protein ALQ19_03743 [Pseudomonas syringae pv. berberidis]RMQ40507.1 hypothetical protein ALQ06_00583 [Pseudomonas syringae pv. berberidis]
MTSIEERLAEIERRLALLEVKDLPPLTKRNDTIELRESQEALIALTVSNKRFDPTNTDLGVYEDHIWFDCSYTLKTGAKPTRAVKGELQFSDLFGEVKFKLQLTINEPLKPGVPLVQRGTGFTYNQFIGEHQWMLITNTKDMTYAFKVSNAIYADGTTELFS